MKGCHYGGFAKRKNIPKNSRQINHFEPEPHRVGGGGCCVWSNLPWTQTDPWSSFATLHFWSAQSLTSFCPFHIFPRISNISMKVSTLKDWKVTFHLPGHCLGVRWPYARMKDIKEKESRGGETISKRYFSPTPEGTRRGEHKHFVAKLTSRFTIKTPPADVPFDPPPKSIILGKKISFRNEYIFQNLKECFSPLGGVPLGAGGNIEKVWQGGMAKKHACYLPQVMNVCLIEWQGTFPWGLMRLYTWAGKFTPNTCKRELKQHSILCSFHFALCETSSSGPHAKIKTSSDQFSCQKGDVFGCFRPVSWIPVRTTS